MDPCPGFVCDGRAYVIKLKICFFSGAKKIILFGGPGLLRFPGICNFVQISGQKTRNLMPFLSVCSYTSKFLSKVRLCTKNSGKTFGTEKKNLTRVVIGCRSQNTFGGPQQPHVTFPGIFDHISKIQTGGHLLSPIGPHLSEK